MNRNIFAAVVVALSLCACSHSYVRGWKGDEVETCCPTSALGCSEGKLAAPAAEKCGSPVTALSGSTIDGTGGTSTYLAGSIFTESSHDICVHYRCDRAPASK